MKFANFVYFCITHEKLIPFSRYWYQFSVRNTKIYKICKLHRVIFFTFYNISQPNFAILLPSGNEFYYFEIFQNFVLYAIGLLKPCCWLIYMNRTSTFRAKALATLSVPSLAPNIRDDQSTVFCTTQKKTLKMRPFLTFFILKTICSQSGQLVNEQYALGITCEF